jgi:hypothetical protein
MQLQSGKQINVRKCLADQAVLTRNSGNFAFTKELVNYCSISFGHLRTDGTLPVMMFGINVGLISYTVIFFLYCDITHILC